MSGGSQKDRGQRRGGNEEVSRRWWRGLAVVVGSALVVVALAGYGLRTPMVLHHWVAPSLEGEAQRRGWDLQVGAMSGVGMTGIRLYDVSLGVDIGQGRAISEVDWIDIYPDLGASLSGGELVVGSVAVGEARVLVSRGAEGSGAEGEREGREGAGRAGRGGWLGEEMGLAAEKVEVVIGGGGPGVEIVELRALVQPSSWKVVALEGRGEVAGVAMAMGLREGAIFVGLSTEDLEALWRDLPLSIGLEGVSVQADGLGKLVRSRDFGDLGLELYGLTAQPRQEGGPTLRAETSSVKGQGQSLRWEAPVALVQGGYRQYELSTVELAYRRDAPGFSFFAEVSDGEGGRVDLEGAWHLPTSLVGINAWFDDFRWDGTLPGAWSGRPPVRQARVDGTFHGDVDLIHRMVSLDGEAHLRELMIDIPFLSAEVVELAELRVGLPLTVDIRGQALSVVDGEVRLGEVAELGFDGRVVEAGGGSHIFSLAMSGGEIEARSLIETLPAQLTGVIADTEMGGRFGVGLEFVGHSAFPESLVMDVSFRGGVEVLSEGKWSQMEALQAGEEVGFGGEAGAGVLRVRGRWQEAAELPRHVPAAIVAAEDAAFYDHDGLDWTGLRLAMVQNLKEGSMVRGGSTITQQVAKNLFLNHDRTASRKLQEAFLTWRVEETMTKEQILELYLNVAQWGPEIYGIYGGSHYYFEKSPEALEPLEAAMLASILPSPNRFGGAVKAGFLPSSRAQKMRRVLENMRFMEQLSWGDYFAAIEELEQGRVGVLEVESCADDESAPQGAPKCDELEVQAGEGEEMVFEVWEVEPLEQEAGWVPLTH